MKSGFIVIFAVFLLIGCDGFKISDLSIVGNTYKQYKLVKEVKEKIEEIQIGMNKKEVLATMRHISWQAEIDGGEIWYFADAPNASEPARAKFDTNGLVIEVVCGDNYRIEKE
jgi:hypothetical protein